MTSHQYTLTVLSSSAPFSSELHNSASWDNCSATYWDHSSPSSQTLPPWEVYSLSMLRWWILLSRNTPDFISPLLWPPNSPDLNPVDPEVWGVLQQRVYHSRIRDVDHLKQSLIEEWRCFDQNIIDRAVRQWRVRLRACVRANGGHFEHIL